MHGLVNNTKSYTFMQNAAVRTSFVHKFVTFVFSFISFGYESTFIALFSFPHYLNELLHKDITYKIILKIQHVVQNKFTWTCPKVGRYHKGLCRIVYGFSTQKRCISLYFDKQMNKSGYQINAALKNVNNSMIAIHQKFNLKQFFLMFCTMVWENGRLFLEWWFVETRVVSIYFKKQHVTYNQFFKCHVICVLL